MTTPVYDELARHWSRLHRFGHVYSIASWDRAAMMPPKGNEARAAALAEMDSLLHGLRTEPRLAELLARAEQEPLDDAERANLREIRRSWVRSNALPARLVEAQSLATSRCEHAWRTQRPAGDWAGFLVNLREVVAAGPRGGEAPGRRHRPGAVRRADGPVRAGHDQRRGASALFADLQAWLPALVARRPRAAGGRVGGGAARPVRRRRRSARSASR